MEMKNFNTWETINALWSFAEITCILDYQTEGLKTIMQYPDGFKFDLIVWDFNVGHCLFPLIEKFGRPPVIAVNPFINQPNILRNIWQSFIPFMAHPHTDHMTLWQKLKSNFFSVVTEITRIIHYIPRQTELAESYFGKVNLTIQEVETNVSLMLANYNPVFNYVEALPPNIIPVGGLHIQSKPLPVDLKNVLDDSKFGVILFSLGSNVQSKELGEEKIQAIIKCFSRINQTVIWKFENNNLTNLPKNIHIRRWVPQNDILGHPNTVLFITHGGLLSSHEIIYNGVPVIGIPFFLDQFQNVENFIAKGIGEKVEFNEITENILCNTIQKVLHDK
ncbi:UDP-glucuronosyltransferase 2B9-like, partial [Asbolus verrucosus]